ncbi:PD-(D/E)XK nuclease family protein [Paenibacillus protaetiae]|uniref:PD-(D/E)XK nuclease family protein n=1 Tax=Paenibacillus protaetiae TaxID=2509456 RepID=UPI0031346162
MKRLHAEFLEAEEHTGGMPYEQLAGFAEAAESADMPAESPPSDESQTDQNAAKQRKPALGGSYTFRLRRPQFMEENSLTAAEKGTVSHLMMQHIPLEGEINAGKLQERLAGMIERRLLTERQAEALDLPAIAAFFDSPLGRRLLQADRVQREVPFSCMFPASRVYPGAPAPSADEPILIQGVIDCLFEDKDGVVLLDYKTDRIYMKQWEQAAEKHRFQLELYAEAIGQIRGKPVDECHVFFFDGGQSVRLR